MTKEVRFDLYCVNCINYAKDETDDPCNDCLANPSNEDSHKPVYFEPSDLAVFIHYLLPDPNVPNWTLDRMKSEKWADHVPDKNELKLYFDKHKGKKYVSYYEKWGGA